jgi:hypothetical protein
MGAVEMSRPLLLLGFIALVIAGCGPVATQAAAAVPMPSPSPAVVACAAQTGGLLTASEMASTLTQAPDLTQWNEGASPTLGLLGNGDANYQSFVGLSQRTFLWTGLYSGEPQELVSEAWSDLHYSGTVPVGFIPSSGALFASYPSSVFRIAEETEDFGTIAEAEKWMDVQRANNPSNTDPTSRNGVESDLTVPIVGDDTFAYQISNGPSGDVLTDIQARVGTVVVSVGIDSGPQVNATASASALLLSLMSKERSTCPGI